MTTREPTDDPQERAPQEEDRTLPLFPSDSEPEPEPPAPASAQLPPEPSEEEDPAPSRRAVTDEERARILHLHDEVRLGSRQIAKTVGRARKTVQRILHEEGRHSAQAPREAPGAKTPARPDKQDRASKLDPFREEVRERVAKGLTTTRILREITALGYEGGRSILSSYVQQVRAPLAPRRKVTRRFETPPGAECQADWSTYRVPIGGAETVVHVLAVVLASSRRAFLWATDSQRLERLLEGLALALEYFQGVTLQVVFDNMAQVSLGRVGRDRRPIWNERFLPFAAHYGFEPVLCQIAHPDRKGEVEAILGYFERDCVRGLEPECRADLNRTIRAWCDGVANKRVHGTTGRIPDEAWEEERPFLIPLPERRYPGGCVEEMRRVAEDCTISVLGTLYTVPARLAHRQVRVRLYTEHFEALDRDGSVAFSRAYVTPREKGRLVLDPAHYDGLPQQRRRRPGASQRLEEQVLERWPELEGFLGGLKRRVKGLVHVHLRQLLRLAEAYGDAALAEAAGRADAAGLHTAQAVERILTAHYEELEDLQPPLPLGAAARVATLLGDVESGSLDDYAHLDEAKPEAEEEDHHGS